MRKLILLSVLSIFFFSCKKDIEELNRLKDRDFSVVDWEPALAVPLLNTRTTLGKMFTEVDSLITKLEGDSLFLTINDDDLFVATYKYPFNSGVLEDYYTIESHSDQLVVELPQETLNAIDALTIGTPTPLPSALFDTTLLFDITPQYGALLELIELSGGEVTIDYSHNFNQNIGVDIQVRSIKQRATNDELSFSFDGLATNPNGTSSKTLPNHNIDLSYTNPISGLEEYNKLEIYVALKGDIVNPTFTGDRFVIDFGIGEYKLDYVQGYVGGFDVELRSTDFRFDVFDQLDIDEVTFRDPRMELNMKSTLGLPMTVSLDTFSVGYKDGSSGSLDLQESEVDILGVSSRSDIPNNPAFTNYGIDRTNSSIDQILGTKPDKIFYALNASSASNIPLQEFFLADTSHIAVELVATLPLDFSVSNYDRKDTIEIAVGDSLGSLGRDEDSLASLVERAEIKLIFENQLPFDVEVQGFLVDSEGNDLAQIFDDGPQTVLRNFNIDANGIAQEPDEVITIIDVDQTKFDHLIKATHIRLESFAKTSGASNVKILSSYQFGVRAGVFANFKIPVEIEKSNND